MSDARNLTAELHRRGLKMEVFYDKGGLKEAPLVTDLQIKKEASGKTLAHCSTLGEVRAFLQGYVACRRDFRDLVDDEDTP